jgi:hypothetical protein
MILNFGMKQLKRGQMNKLKYLINVKKIIDLNYGKTQNLMEMIKTHGLFLILLLMKNVFMSLQKTGKKQKKKA